jgi:hypothetical protein
MGVIFSNFQEEVIFMVAKSQPFSFIPEDVKSILIGACIAGAGALLTFIVENVGKLNFGEWTPFVVAGVSVVVNIIRKWIGSFKYTN